MFDDNEPVTELQLDRAIESLRDDLEGRIADLENTVDNLRGEIDDLRRTMEGNGIYDQR